MIDKMKLLSTQIAAITLLGLSGAVSAQIPSIADEPLLEEVVTFAKLKTAADDVAVERLESEVVADIIDSETIGRIGDSTVASALRLLGERMARMDGASGVLLVPDDRTATWWGLIRHFAVVGRFAMGDAGLETMRLGCWRPCSCLRLKVDSLPPQRAVGLQPCSPGLA